MTNATYRGFNYPHHTSNYWAMCVEHTPIGFCML